MSRPRVVIDGLGITATPERWHGSKALVHLDQAVCPVDTPSARTPKISLETSRTNER